MPKPLARAVAARDLDLCQQLMLSGVDPLAPDQYIQADGRTMDLLEAAIAQGWAAGVAWFLAHGMEPKPWHLEAALLALLDRPGKPAHGGEDIVDALLDAGVRVEPRALWCSVQPGSVLSTRVFEKLVTRCQGWPAPSAEHTIGTRLLESKLAQTAQRLELLAQAGPVFTEVAGNGDQVWKKLVLRPLDGETLLLADLVFRHQGWRSTKNPDGKLGEDMALMVQRFPDAATAHISHPRFPWDELSPEDKELMLAAGINNSPSVGQWMSLMLEAGAKGDKPVTIDGQETSAVHTAIQKAGRRRDGDIMAIRMGLAVQTLMDHGVDPNTSIEGSDSPMNMALAGNAARPVIDALIRAGGLVSIEFCSPFMDDEKRHWLLTVAQEQAMEIQTPAASGTGRQPRL